MTSACDHFRYSVTTAATFLRAMLLCKIPDEEGDGKRQVDGDEDRPGDGDAGIGRVVAARIGADQCDGAEHKAQGRAAREEKPQQAHHQRSRCGVADAAPCLAVAAQAPARIVLVIVIVVTVTRPPPFARPVRIATFVPSFARFGTASLRSPGVSCPASGSTAPRGRTGDEHVTARAAFDFVLHGGFVDLEHTGARRACETNRGHFFSRGRTG